MPLDAIKITVKSVNIPDSWISAKEAREIATSINNQNFVNFMNKIMEVVKIASEEGRTSCGVSKRYENNEIIERAVDLLRSLGYEVTNTCSALNINW